MGEAMMCGYGDRPPAPWELRLRRPSTALDILSCCSWSAGAGFSTFKAREVGGPPPPMLAEMVETGTGGISKAREPGGSEGTGGGC